MENIYNWFGGRKTTFAILLLIAVTIFLFLDKATFSNWSEFVIWIFGVYALGNGVEHIGKGLKK